MQTTLTMLNLSMRPSSIILESRASKAKRRAVVQSEYTGLMALVA